MYQAAARDAFGYAFRLGNLLIEVKERVGHKHFLAWIEKHCAFTPRWGQAVMRIARHYESANAKSTSHLTASAALAAISKKGKELPTGVEIGTPTDWRDHWRGMPEYVREDLTPWKTLKVHFYDPEQFELFAKLIGTRLTSQTRSVQFPPFNRTDRQAGSIHAPIDGGAEALDFLARTILNVTIPEGWTPESGVVTVHFAGPQREAKPFAETIKAQQEYVANKQRWKEDERAEKEDEEPS
jgi:hypothetical protein